MPSPDANGPATGGPRRAVLATAATLSRRLPPSRAKRRVGRVLAAALGSPSGVPAPVGGLSFLLAPADRTAAEPFWDGTYEDDLVDFLAALVEPDWVVADVGANVGLIAVRLAARLDALGGSGTVLAFEPVAANAELLEATLRRNDLGRRCRVARTALGDRNGEAVMRVERWGSGSGNAVLDQPSVGRRAGSPLGDGAGPATDHLGGAPVAVTVSTLDDLWRLGDVGRLDLVKLDVEGAEVAVLRGARATVASLRPIVVGEFNAALMPRHGTTVLDAVALLGPTGYRSFAFADRLSLVEVEPVVGAGDLCLVPDERVPEVAAKLAAVGGSLR